MSKRRVRRVSVGIRIVDRGESRNLIDDLLRAIRIGSKTGDYSPPNRIIAIIYWTNPPGPRKYDEFANALAESATSSRGFDKLIKRYLERRRKKNVG